MRHALVRVGLALASAAALAACRDSTATSSPAPEWRIYALQSVAGQPLPFVESASGGDTTTLLGEMLRLRTDGTAMRATTVRVVNGGTPTVSSYSGLWSYRTSGPQLTLDPICGPGALCIVGDSGTISDAEITLVSRARPDGPVWRYARAISDPAAVGGDR